MKSVRVLALAVVSAVLLDACSKGTGVAVPSLTRPGDIAFACFDKTTSSFLPTLAECAGVTGASSETKKMIGFVIETTRGEVGALDWQNLRAIDSDLTVPGYTFVRVGDSPSAIVVPENDSRMTFVANYGSFSVQSLETAAFVPDAVQDTQDLLNPTIVTLPAGPTDLAYIETANAKWLFAALPDVGSIAQIPVGSDGSLGTPVILAVSSSIPAAVAATVGPEFLEVCPNRYTRTASATPRAPVTLGATPQPNQLSIANRPSGVELVASDAALPVIHRFSVSDAGLTETTGFYAAVPTLDVVTTPLLPLTDAVAPTPLAPTEQYVYAIDAVGKRVMAVDYASGAVVPINVGDEDADRVPYESPAIALEMLAPGYDLTVDPSLDAIRRMRPTRDVRPRHRPRSAARSSRSRWPTEPSESSTCSTSTPNAGARRRAAATTTRTTSTCTFDVIVRVSAISRPTRLRSRRRSRSSSKGAQEGSRRPARRPRASAQGSRPSTTGIRRPRSAPATRG